MLTLVDVQKPEQEIQRKKNKKKGQIKSFLYPINIYMEANRLWKPEKIEMKRNMKTEKAGYIEQSEQQTKRCRKTVFLTLKM